MPHSISIRITQRNDEISPFGWIIKFWVQKLICILSFLLFFKITAYLIIFFWWFDNILKGSYYDFLLKCEKWLKIKKTTKKQQIAKIGEKKLFFQKMFLPWRRPGLIFFIVNSDRHFKGVFKKNYKNFENSVLLCPGCLEWPPLGANFFGGGKKNL